MKTRPSAAESATAEPEMPANMTEAPILANAVPPRSQLVAAEAIEMSRAVMPPWLMISAARM